MKRPRLTWGPALLLLLVPACTTVVEIRRREPPVIELTGPHPGLGILAIEASDPAAAPRLFGEVKGFLSREAANLTVVDYTQLGPRVEWRVDPKEPDRWLPPVLPALPDDIQTPLCATIKVVDWRLDKEPRRDGRWREKARVALLVSTFTRSGELVHHSEVWASAESGFYGVVVGGAPSNASLVHDFNRAYPESPLMSGGDAMFQAAVRGAVAFYFFRFVPVVSSDRFTLEDDARNREGLRHLQQGRYREAAEAWSRVTLEDPTAPSAFYNLGIAYFALGELDRAEQALVRAFELSGTDATARLLERVRERARMRKVVP